MEYEIDQKVRIIDEDGVWEGRILDVYPEKSTAAVEYETDYWLISQEFSFDELNRFNT